MGNAPLTESLICGNSQHTVRFLARDAKNPIVALVYWLGLREPSIEPSFYHAMHKFAPLMQLILPDERPGVFVNKSAVHFAHDHGIVKRLVFKDQSSLKVRYSGPCTDLYVK